MKLLFQTLSGRCPALLGATICLLVAVFVLVGAPARGLAQSVNPYDAEVVQTNADLSQALTRLPDLTFGGAAAGHGPMIAVNAGVRFQRVQGFGGAMTDTAAWLIERKISAAARNELMSELFGAGGIRLNFLRVPMGASDFTHTGHPYTYDDLAPGHSDPGLTHFSISHDQGYILPALRQVRALNPGAELLANPWSPPAWMKGNDSLQNGGNLGTLRGSAYGPWARYFVKFIRAYAKAGVSIGAVTPGNEPGIPTLYPGLNLSAPSAANWIVQDLKPALGRAGLRTKIYAGDLGWGPNTDYVSSSAFGRAGSDLAGLAWHCYYGSPGSMGEFHRLAPRLDEIVDECSPGLISPTPMSEIVISSLREWASTVSLWNLALDPTGGPAELPNHGCEGCVGLAVIDPQTGAVSLNRAYYQLGQASAFVLPGAQRISAGHFVSYVYPRSGVNVVTPGLDDVAFRNSDGSIALVAYNNGKGPIQFGVRWRGRAFSYELPAMATVTFVWNRP